MPSVKPNSKLICIIGDIMIDHYIYGNCNRISPEIPVPVVEAKNESFTLGGAGNVLKNVISLGFKADIISVIGDDDNGRYIIEEITKYNVSAEGIVKDFSRCTTTKSRVMVTNHQLLRLDYENNHPIGTACEHELLHYFTKNIDNYQIVLISDYNKGLLTPFLLSGILKISNEKNIKVIVDPKGLDFGKYYGTTVIKPNKKEASLVTGINITDNETLALACERIKQITGCEHVIITMSEDGIAIYDDEKLLVIPTKALDIVDVTGAGDTVLASLSVALASGSTVKKACDFANHAAAVVIKKIGSATVTMNEINETFKTTVDEYWK